MTQFLKHPNPVLSIFRNQVLALAPPVCFHFDISDLYVYALSYQELNLDFSNLFPFCVCPLCDYSVHFPDGQMKSKANSPVQLFNT